MAIRIITHSPQAFLTKVAQQLHQMDAHWKVDNQNEYLQRSREADYPYYFRYILKEKEVELVFMDVHNQYAASSVNKYAGELIGILLTIFMDDSLLKTLEAEPYSLPNF
ncbi:hypothetical protein Q0590_29925 [Rhodocytophaga aerolata]|uniref:Uncharacterized protein n=1 Tax=Rhodocytophaga aerolata TaxID=455078 RepID=A0ABT8REM8_9BACT|nr:hypothetical protein [Rhodocytophaga aerolata]MDO1450532.1 hypothetical protein [Rhodocytophaga aerolata]